MNDLFLDALSCKNQGRPPVWLMRQAGRYLPSYRALRQKHTLSELFHTPELALEVTHLPFKVLDLDAAILFSDILVIVEVFGLKLVFPEGASPQVIPPLTSLDQIKKLVAFSVEEKLAYVFEIIRLLRPTLKVPLIGFSGAPFTIATYMIEGGAEQLNRWIQEDPLTVKELFDKISDALIEYLHLQVKSGVQAIQIFDSWANRLSYPDFLNYSLPYLQKMVEALQGTPVILFCRGSSLLFEELASLRPAGISFDGEKSMRELRSRVSKTIAVQGNIPNILLSEEPLVVEKTVKILLEEMRGETGFIVNLSHGILPTARLESVQRLVDLVRCSRNAL